MSPLDYPDPAERLAADETDRALAQLLGDYVTRRAHRTTPEVLDLLTAAGEHGHQAISQMRDLIAFYEALHPGGAS
ncbi:hypothetical protein [Paraconexibacter algicola]|uniref:Uncharacterized protein n=1 Tax=Paraconexibacter algicola TaxID=2133960 RepID=A0A2T4ULX5_9ACTN|nr:hypothetical protein [Paraconexibacter algicola]PTL60263.1 hypothetical protein C7Y72_11750 [Paraconexibacter algicola]